MIDWRSWWIPVSCAVVLLGACLLAAHALSQDPPAPAPVQVVVEMVPHAKFKRAVSGWRRESKRAHRLRAEVRRLRALPPSPFTVEDTRLAARLVAVVGGWPEQGSLRVAWCESHHQPGARNGTELGGSHASGSWQVLWPGTWRSTDVGRAFPDQGSAFNPYLNAFAALRVWQRHDGSFAEWADVCARQG